VIRARRGGRPERALTDGPGKLCEALAIGLDDSALDLTDLASPIRILDDGTPPPGDPIVGPRVGISKATDTPWRFRVPAHLGR
jgi:DNA-3-methyladenine glycosylase